MSTWPEYLQQIKERIAKATKGPWSVNTAGEVIGKNKSNRSKSGLVNTYVMYGDYNGSIQVSYEDMDFIISSRTDIEKLVLRVEELTEALKTYKNLPEWFCGHDDSSWCDERCGDTGKKAREILSKELQWTPEDEQ